MLMLLSLFSVEAWSAHTQPHVLRTARSNVATPTHMLAFYPLGGETALNVHTTFVDEEQSTNDRSDTNAELSDYKTFVQAHANNEGQSRVYSAPASFL